MRFTAKRTRRGEARQRGSGGRETKRMQVMKMKRKTEGGKNEAWTREL